MLNWIAKWADYTPNKVALTSYDTNESYTYSSLDTYADKLVVKFTKMGLEEGDRVAVLAEHGLAFIVLFVACQRMGVVLVPLNYRLSISELQRLVSDCTPSLFIYSKSFTDKVEGLQLGETSTLLMLLTISS